MRSTKEWLNRTRDVDLRFCANLRSELDLWLFSRLYTVNCARRGAGSAHNHNVTTPVSCFQSSL